MFNRLFQAFFAISLLFPADSIAQVVPLDVSGVQTGPVVTEQQGNTLIVRWPDETSRLWTAEFSLDPAHPLITAIRVGDKTIVERARPLYWCETGKRRGGWDAFFSFGQPKPALSGSDLKSSSMVCGWDLSRVASPSPSFQAAT